MFAIVVAGRLPQEFNQLGETEFLCEVPNIETVNHVVVFMTGTGAFPADMGGSVYIRWPMPGAESNWHFLGYICNQKQSAIFKIAQVRYADAKCLNMFDGQGCNIASAGCAQIGIMVESLQSIEIKVVEHDTIPSDKSTLAEFGDSMVKNLVNHVESFVVRLPKQDGQGFADYVPLHAFTEWINNFTRRFKLNPNFWKTLKNA